MLNKLYNVHKKDVNVTLMPTAIPSSLPAVLRSASILWKSNTAEAINNIANKIAIAAMIVLYTIRMMCLSFDLELPVGNTLALQLDDPSDPTYTNNRINIK